MSKNIELQEEFEVLISELERLKSINEITSSNSENAKNTIDEVNSFVQSVKIFKTSIESDYQAKKKDFEGVESSLNVAIGALNDNIDEQSKRFEKLASNHTSASKKTLETVKGELEEKINDFTSEINTLKENLATEVTAFTEVTCREIDDSSAKLNELVISIKTSLDKELTSLNKVSNNHQAEVLRQLALLNKEIELNKESVKKLRVVILIGFAVAMVTFGFLLYK